MVAEGKCRKAIAACGDKNYYSSNPGKLKAGRELIFETLLPVDEPTVPDLAIDE